MTKRQNKSTLPSITSQQAFGVVAGSFLLLMLLCQLFTFEDFPGLLSQVISDKATGLALLFALVFSEVIALPYLLGMTMPRRLAITSRAAGGAAILLLAVIEGLVIFNGGDTSVLFGATFMVPSGVWSLLFLGAVGVLMIWKNIPANIVMKSKNIRKKK